TPNPRRPVASNSRLAGSGTDGERVTKIAPLGAVAWISAKPPVGLPISQNPTMYDPSGRPGLMLSSGDMCGLEELCIVIGSEGVASNTKKPVAPGSSAFVAGRNASIG